MTEDKIKKLQELMKLINDSVTKQEFVDAFVAVYKYIRKMKQANDSEIEGLTKKFDRLTKAFKAGAESEISSLKEQIASAVQDRVDKITAEHEAKMALVDQKMSEVRDGEDADPDAIVREVLRQLPMPEPIDLSIYDDYGNRIEELEKSIKNAPVQRSGFFGGSRHIQYAPDVKITDIQNDDVLKWNSTTRQFENGAASGGGAVDSVNGQTGVVVLDTGDITEAADKNYVTDADLVNLGNLSGTNTGDQDLSTYFKKDTDDTDDITVGATNKFATAAEKTKLGHITVTQAVDLDTIESDTATNNAKVTNATHTGEVTGSGALTLDKTAISNKSTVNAAVGDHVLIGDASDSDNLKKVTIQTIIDLVPPGGGSGITRSIVITSGNVTADDTASVDYVYLVAGAHTVTLPTAASNTNRYTIKNTHSAAITIDTTGAETIDGTLTITINPQSSVDLISDNSNWNVI